MQYNPFSKNLEEIESEDLAILEDIPEGWFIDYKREPVSLKKFAKSICAFSNQFGGWLFIGIDENEKDQTAEDFLGIKANKISDVLIQIRNAVSAHIQPTPNYKTKVINGPCKAINLKKNKAIIVVSIPKGIFPPYIHSRGKIYRRVGDESKPENDRYELDKLWQRGERLKEEFKDFLNDKPYYKNYNLPKATVYLLSDPKREIELDNLSFQDFQSVMRDASEQSIKTPFDTIFSSSKGFIARQHENNDPNQDVLTFRWRHTGNAILEVPLNFYPQVDFIDYLKYNNEGQRFLKLLRKQGFKTCSIIDFSYFLKVLAAAINAYSRLFEILNLDEDIYLKVKISNIGGKTPYLSSEEYFNEIDKWGLPIIKENEIWCPDGLSLSDLSKVELDNDKETVYVSAGIMGIVLRSVGILRDIDNFESIKDIVKSAFSSQK